ncbi:peptidoglycan DD-metalloendopeptidase family protein [Arthrobacter rhombi]|uniref:peptidoglycan DD-metalloendopeptidase family protein n=1 Tax=Arthrobacter rhombi TaxID=71253 RepID=UPI003FD084C7
MADQQTSKRTGWILAIAALLVVGLGAVLLVPLAGLGMLMSLVSANEASGSAQCVPGGGANTVGTQVAYSGEWVNPTAGSLTSPYGGRVNPVTGSLELHSGQDIAAPDGSAIVAAADGVVEIAGKSSGGNSGYMVAINHGGGVQSRYVHSWPDGMHVKIGQKVIAGEHISDVGASGNATGPHLHFGIRINGQPTNPMDYMAKRGISLGKNNANQDKQKPSTAVVAKAEEKTTFVRTDGEEFQPSKEQLKNLSAVIEAAKSHGASEQATVIALMTVLQESKGTMYANSGLPKSLKLPHQNVGSDHDSVGLFQQRPSQGWGSIKELMSVDPSTGAFLDALGLVKGWEGMSLSEAAQEVQRSAFPDAYAKWEPIAISLATGKNLPKTSGTSSCPAPVEVAKPSDADDSAATRSKVIDLAREGLGGKYVKGGRAPGAWDDDGFVYHCFTEAGVRGIPYVSSWTRGETTSSPESGDLVVSDQQGDGTWNQVGIKVGGQYFITVTTKGTTKLPIPGDAEFFSMVGEDAT